MNIYGIIAEYNPFHNGHAFQLDQARKNGATHIAVAMSGSMVQRGEVAIFSKWARARAALLNGADLIVELPTPYVLSSANGFASAGVAILNQLSTSTLYFGAENDDISILEKVAKCVLISQESDELKLNLKTGSSYPLAVFETVKLLFGDEIANTMSTPNNLLAIEYINAIKTLSATMKPACIKREGVEHDSNQATADFASASKLRKIIEKGKLDQLKSYIPQSALEIYESEIRNGTAPILQERLEGILLYKLFSLQSDEIALLPDVTEGLENRIARVAKECNTLISLYEGIKTKRYTMARIRRILQCAITNVTASDAATPVSYIRVLGMNERGKEILAAARKSSTLPISPKFADLYSLHPTGIDCDVNATRLASLASPKISEINDFITNTIIL